MAVLVEACVDALASARAAAAGHAGRLELCAALTEGGLTPSLGMIAAVREAVSVPIHLLVRPRGGDFVHDDDELALMRRDIEAARGLGVQGIVLGVLRPDGRVDAEAVARLAEAARPLRVVFHRAVDVTPDGVEALETLLALGLDGVLTSGRARHALDGAPEIARFVARAGDALEVIAAGKIAADTAAEVVRRTGVRAVHLRGGRVRKSRMTHRGSGVSFVSSPPDNDARIETDAKAIGQVVEAVG